MTVLQQILTILSSLAAAAKPFLVDIPEGAAADALAAELLTIAQTAIAAHEQITGQPIDLALLHPLDPIP